MTDRIQLLVIYSSSGGIPFTHCRVQTSKADTKLNDDVVVHRYKYLKTSCFTTVVGKVGLQVGKRHSGHMVLDLPFLLVFEWLCTSV